MIKRKHTANQEAEVRMSSTKERTERNHNFSQDKQEERSTNPENNINLDDSNKKISATDDNQRSLRSQLLPQSAKKARGKNLKCHFCQVMNKSMNRLLCRNYPNCKCLFCFSCLKEHFNVTPVKPAFDSWTCFACTGDCNCEQCRNQDDKSCSEEVKVQLVDTIPKSKGSDKEASLPAKTARRTRKRRKADSEDSGSVYLPTYERQRKRERVVDKDNSDRIVCITLRNKNETSLKEDKRPEVKEIPAELPVTQDLSKLPYNFNSIRPVNCNQGYGVPVPTGAPQIQYVPYQIPYMMQQMGGYGPIMGNPFYQTIPYPLYNEALNLEYLERSRVNTGLLQPQDCIRENIFVYHSNNK